LRPRWSYPEVAYATRSAPACWSPKLDSSGDALSAYLRFDYIRSRPEVDEAAVFLTADETAHGPDYRITILATNDVVTAIPYLAGLQARAIINGFKLTSTPAQRVRYLRQQTAIFVAAYNRPVRRKLDEIDPHGLAVPVSR
jgi:hypothetical protein